VIDLENQDHTVALVLPFDSTLDEDTDQAGLANLFASSPDYPSFISRIKDGVITLKSEGLIEYSWEKHLM